MTWWHRLWRRNRLETELDAELRDHVERQVAEEVRSGALEPVARRRARLQFGGLDQIKERCRDVRGTRWLDEIWQDLRYAVRLLAKHRSFTAVAVLALGIGIGINTAMVTMFIAHTVRGLPVANADRVLLLSTQDDRARRLGFSYADFEDARTASRSYEGLAAYTGVAAVIGDDDQPSDRYQGAYVSVDLFRLIGETPIAGRDFNADDDLLGAPAVAILGSSVWRSRYGADPATLGRTVRVDGRLVTVVGVMPDQFRFPNGANLWLPIAQMPELLERPRDVRGLDIVGRLVDGVSLEEARTEIDRIGSTLAAAYPASNAEIRFTARPINDRFNANDPVWDRFVQIGFIVLLVACTNVAGLLVMRSVSRTHEVSIRASLGATRWQLLRQLLVESAVLALAGGIVGLGVSTVGLRAIRRALGADGLPYWIEYTMDARVFGVLSVVCLGSVFIFGLMPAIHLSKTRSRGGLTAHGFTVAGEMHTRRLTGMFLIVQVGLALLFGAMLVKDLGEYRQSEWAMRVVDPVDLHTMWISLPGRTYPTDHERHRFYDRVTMQLDEIGTIDDVAVTSAVPFAPLGARQRQVALDVTAASMPDTLPSVLTVRVDDAYFDTLGLEVGTGRDFNQLDGTPGHASAIVNRRFADIHFPGTNPVGQRLQLHSGTMDDVTPWLTIVGVAPMMDQRAGPVPDPVVFLPSRGTPPVTAALIVRSSRTLTAVTAVIRETVQRLDPDLPVYRVRTMAQVLADARGGPRMSLQLFFVVASVALGLAAIGLYALTAHTVALRTQELGIRMALGAERGHVRWIVVRRVMTHVALGIGAGVALSTVLPFDTSAPTLAAGSALLAAAALAAASAPMRRATRFDPATVLRWE
ncbi:MAG: ADOP family duplicated permease [Vicinamibacterales bacterium]|nr:ADOP family duplicated permease [Vicinamibacterales bacterium]